MRNKIILTSVFLCVFASFLLAQSPQDKTQLEKERKDLQKELQEIQGLYNKVKGQAKQTIGQLNVLKRKIDLQEQYIGSIS